MKQQIAHRSASPLCGIVVVVAILGWMITLWCENFGPGNSEVTKLAPLSASTAPKRTDGAVHSAIKHVLFRGLAAKECVPGFLQNDEDPGVKKP